MSQFKSVGGAVVEYPKPKKPIRFLTFNSYKAAIKQLFHEQQANHRMMSTWEHVWLPTCNKLRDYVKLRKPRIKKETI
jgi:hypothetical protein